MKSEVLVISVYGIKYLLFKKLEPLDINNNRKQEITRYIYLFIMSHCHIVRRRQLDLVVLNSTKFINIGRIKLTIDYFSIRDLLEEKKVHLSRSVDVN